MPLKIPRQSLQSALGAKKETYINRVGEGFPGDVTS